jgi:acyl dehydratase
VAQHTIDAAKFLAPVTPGTPLTLRDEAAGPAGLRLTIASPMGLVATATLSPP